MTKRQKIEKILDLLKKMEGNSFLLPDSWSEVVNMVSRSAHFKTYVGGRGFNRYINIEYVDSSEIYNPKAEDRYSIEVRNDVIYLHKRLGDRKNEIDVVLDIVGAIYTEKMSFDIMATAVATKRKRLIDINVSLKSLKDEFNKIKKELADKDKVGNEK